MSTNEGNPVFNATSRTSELYQTKSLPERFEEPAKVQGYGTGRQANPLYQTSNSSYGAAPPTAHTMPTEFHGKSMTFSEHLGKAGMYRNHSLNTSVDRSRVLSHFHE
eukprot:m.227382 g.227382  ORF g.227382 m.227382 type:complete len:107 (+) comp11576_c0_seq1:89-409(+)